MPSSDPDTIQRPSPLTATGEPWTFTVSAVCLLSRSHRLTVPSKPDAADKKSKITFGDYATAHLAQNALGVLLLERLDLIKNRSYVIYDPALPVLPATLEAIGSFQRETRYRMLETVRQYAQEKLVENGEADDLRNRHLSYFTQQI